MGCYRTLKRLLQGGQKLGSFLHASVISIPSSKEPHSLLGPKHHHPSLGTLCSSAWCRSPRLSPLPTSLLCACPSLTPPASDVAPCDQALILNFPCVCICASEAVKPVSRNLCLLGNTVCLKDSDPAELVLSCSPPSSPSSHIPLWILFA